MDMYMEAEVYEYKRVNSECAPCFPEPGKWDIRKTDIKHKLSVCLFLYSSSQKN